MVHERQNDVPVEKQPFSLTGMGDIGELVSGNIELPGENLTVAGRLIEHVNVIRILKNVFDLT